MKAQRLRVIIEEYLKGKYSKETVSSYLYAIDRFTKRHPNAKRLKLSQIESYMLELKNKNNSRNYCNSQLAAIKAFYQCLVEVREIKEHPCKNHIIKEKKPSGKSFNELLTPEEIESLIERKEERYNNLKCRNKSIISLLVYQGITSKELINLKVRDIDLDDGSISIRRFGRNNPRSFNLRDNQLEWLMNYLNNERPNLVYNKTEILFLGIRKTHLTVDGLHSFVSRLGYGLSNSVSPKKIRESVIHYWLNIKKHELSDVQLMAGHQHLSTTEKYLRQEFLSLN